MILTTAELKRRGACKDAIDFFARNYPNGLDLNQWQIRGEFANYVSWLQNSLQIQYKYDSKGNRISETHPDGSVWRYEYDDRGNQISSTHPHGRVWRWGYDDQGNLTSKADPDGRVWRWEYIYSSEGCLSEIRENGQRVCWLEANQGESEKGVKQHGI